MPGLLGFASFSAYTRVLTPSEYAVYSVGASVSFLIGNVCYGWVRFSIGRFQAEMPDFNFLPFALTCLATTTLVVAPIAIGGAAWATHAPTLVIGGVLFLTMAQALFDTTQEMRRARRQSVAFTTASVIRSFVGMALSVTAACCFHRGAAVLLSIAAGFGVLGVAYLVRNRQWLIASDIWLGPTRRFLAYGMPLALSGLVFSGNSTLARVMVANALGTYAVGQYGAALDLTGQLTTMIGASVCSIMGPAAVRAYGRHGASAARHELAAGLELLLAILLPVVVGVAIVAKPFATVVSGHDFEGVLGELIPILVVSRGLNVFCQFYLHLGFQIVEKPLRQVACGGTTLAINVVMNFVLTREFGLSGAAVALVLADLGGVLVSFMLLHPAFPMPFPFHKVARIVASVGVMAVACQAIMNVFELSPTRLLGLSVATSALAYGAAILFFDICGARTLLWPQGYRALINQLRRV